MALPIAVLTSGGDSPGMNAALRSIVKLCARQGVTVLGVEQGYDGLIDGRFRELTAQDVDPIGAFGGTLLGSARSRRFMTSEGRKAAAERLAGCHGLIVIGGNGSLTGALALSEETGTKVMGLPASIDNDIGCTSTCIGVDTALNTIVQACDRISDTARAHRRAFVVEVMGRSCGYLAMGTAIAAGADACLYREQGKDEDALVTALIGVLDKSFGPARDKKRVLVIKAEGVQVPTDHLVRRLQEHAEKHLPGVDVRGTVLGHVVRGGSPTYLDRMVSQRLSAAAVEALLAGRTAEMAAWQPWTREEGVATEDPSVWRFPLTRVLTETAALIDGASPVTKRRVRMMEAYEGVLAL